MLAAELERKFVTAVSTKTEWSNDEASMYNLIEPVIKWYTGRSRTSIGTNAGVFRPGHRYSEPLEKFSSVFQAKVQAIDKCAHWIEDKKSRQIAIVSDSEAAY